MLNSESRLKTPMLFDFEGLTLKLLLNVKASRQTPLCSSNGPGQQL